MDWQELWDGGGEEEAEEGDEPQERQDPALSRTQGERAQVLISAKFSNRVVVARKKKATAGNAIHNLVGLTW